MMSKPAMDQVHPLELLVACHRRFNRYLHSLTRSGRLLAVGKCDASVGRALEESLRFFRETAPLHSIDEEESLFPRMKQAMPQSDEMFEHLLKRIVEDHAELDSLHATIDADGRAIITMIDGLEAVERGSLEPTLSRFRSGIRYAREIYRSHMIVEERDIFPLAAALLSHDELRQAGAEMAARRNPKTA